MLTEFLNEDFLIKEMQVDEAQKTREKEKFMEEKDMESDENLSSIQKASSRRKIDNGSAKLRMQKDGSMRLSNEVHNQITKQ